ncbi:MAG TPA: SDR family NAD(P)-dependent oxidoreductase [Gaiellales bacterium]|jgi:NAD(P)-dependent dehydrogenase (short-subunit alcohol dehydrogenase family)
MSSHSDSRVAVVTGAAGGIGAAIAARLAADGFAVAGADLAEGADHRCDVRSEADVQRLRDEVTARLAAPSLLVNVAGVFFEHRITELAADDWDLILDTNLKGTFLTCKTFLPAMIAAGSGCIVNIASTAGIRGGRTRAAYCAAKAGVVNLTRSLALDHGGDGVRICCVCPGLIDTPMADWITSRPDALREFADSVPARRIGTVDDIAGAVSFLASADASYVHGSVLVVDGGVTA